MKKEFEKFIIDYKKTYYDCLSRFNKSYNSDLVILLYHGITKYKSKGIENISKKHITEKEFYSQMEHVKKNCNLLSMDEVIYCKESNKKYPPNSVVITFDDGFENNYTTAAPILNELKIPATFYISSGMVNSKELFWADIIEDCINRCKASNINILLEKNHSFSLLKRTDKIMAMQIIKNYCKANHKDKKNRVIKNLINETLINPDEKHSLNYKKLNWEQLKELDKNKLFIIGGHSTFHDILTKQSDDSMADDIKMSIDLLEKKLEHKIYHYSYPEGLEDHYNLSVKKELKSIGIKASPSAICGLNQISNDLFELRRIQVGFWGLPFPFFDAFLK